MINLGEVLPIFLYFFGIILMIVLIYLGIRIIQIVDKLDRVLDNVEDKVNSLNGLFNVINKATSSIDLISTKIVTSITDNISKLFKKKMKKEENDYE